MNKVIKNLYLVEYGNYMGPYRNIKAFINYRDFHRSVDLNTCNFIDKYRTFEVKNG